MDDKSPDPGPELTPTPPIYETGGSADPPLTEEPQTLRGWLMQNGILIGVLAVIGGIIWWRVGAVNPWTTLWVILGLGLLIFIHELGHFLAAKWCDVHVETFSVGFGPPIPGCAFRWGETTYMIGLIPLGGYVKMVGEGTDGEEGEEDPRSFKNKTVWQRMIIISAGVIMNLLLGLACFILVAQTHGVREIPATIGIVSPGSPAWEAGIRPGDVITRVANRKEPAFTDINLNVMKSAANRPIRIDDVHVVDGKLQTPIELEVTPRPVPGHPLPMFGLGFARKATLGKSEKRLPYREGSPAAKAGEAGPGFDVGDRILATSDPDQTGPYDPNKLADLPDDPRTQEGDEPQPDFFVLQNRMTRLADKPIVLRVKRADPKKHDGAEAENIQIAANPVVTLPGLVMQMGDIVAIRKGSTAADHDIHARDANKPGDKGDRIWSVRVELPGGSPKRFREWTADRSLKAEPDVDVQPLDPSRLPWELQRWAASWDRVPAEERKYDVLLTVTRPDVSTGHEVTTKRVPVTLKWDKDRTFEEEAIADPTLPLTIPGLGLAYLVESVVAHVEKDSLAEKAGFAKDDVITEVTFPDTKVTEKIEHGDPKRTDRWGGVFLALQQTSKKEIRCKVANKPDITLTATPADDWYQADRGLLFDVSTRYRKSKNIGDALWMAVNLELYYADMIYTSLRNLVTRPQTLVTLSGPLSIAAMSYQTADRDLYDYIILLGILNVNLAIVNFLPIPVLDGGHMVFLIYEGVRGRPPSERWRDILTVAGLLFILGLMVLVVSLDVLKYFFSVDVAKFFL